MSSDSMAFLAFMRFPLSRSGTPRTDQPGRGASLTVADNQESPSSPIADGDKATFVVQVSVRVSSRRASSAAYQPRRALRVVGLFGDGLGRMRRFISPSEIVRPSEKSGRERPMSFAELRMLTQRQRFTVNPLHPDPQAGGRTHLRRGTHEL
jgi:hypothetical protein